MGRLQYHVWDCRIPHQNESTFVLRMIFRENIFHYPYIDNLPTLG